MSGRRALLVGAGGMGRAWARVLRDHPDVELAGWIDVADGVAEQAAADLAVRPDHVGTDLGVALGAASPDFVVDVTVPDAHHQVTMASLDAGIPVLGEKPLAATMGQARDLVAASERTGVLFMVSQNRRFNPGLSAFRHLIRTQLGTLSVLAASFYKAPHFGGFRDAMASPLLVDMAIHTFDAARWASGADPVSVVCEEWNPPWSWYQGAACAVATFEMSDGSRFLYEGSWCAPGAETSWESSWRAVGQHGSARWDGTEAPVAELVDGAASRTVTATLDLAAPADLAGSLEAFLEALRTGAAPVTDCRDNIRSLAMVFSALDASTSGRRVPVAW